MKNDTDRITYKLKNYNKKAQKDNDSNNSSDSIEMEIQSFNTNKKMIGKKTDTGEEIKFFFNSPITENKKENKNNYSRPSFKINQASTFNFSKRSKEFNFKDILLNYVQSPKCKIKKKDDDDKNNFERRNSVIYGNPETILTLNGDEDDEDSENPKISKKSQEKSSDSNSNSKSGSYLEIYSKAESNNDNGSLKESNDKDKNQLTNSKDSSYKSNKSKSKIKFNDSMKIFINLKNSDKKINKEKKNDSYSKNKNNEIESEKEEENNESNPFSQNEIIKMKYSDGVNNRKNNKDSCLNSYKNSQNIKSSNGNTFTTTTNTHHTHNTHNSSIQSLKINNKNINYNYLCWNNLSLPKKVIIKNRSSSVKRINSIDIIKNKDNFIKDEKTTIMIFRLKNLNISLDIEKSYSYYFKYLTKLQYQKAHFKKSSTNNLSYSMRNQRIDSYKQKFENNINYPNEYYINRKNNLHNKYHISNLFEKLRESKNNV